MRRALQPNTKITLLLSGRTTEFFIHQVLGGGGSCIAYDVTYFEAEDVMHRAVLKEYCPVFLNSDGDFQRDGTQLVIQEDKRAEFEAGLDNFRQVYRRINRYLVENPSAANYHPVQLGFCEGNCTAYTLASRDYGENYAQLQDEDLVSLLELILSVTKAVGYYHEAGFLHLDIKPENIFILDGVKDIVRLFDYDSIISADKFIQGSAIGIPHPGVYYVPELEGRNIRAIGTHTDIFEIGAMLFLRLFGRSPKPEEMEADGEIPLEEASLLKGVSPTVLYEIEDLFKHTIQIARRKRYQTTRDLCNKLQKLIKLAKEEAPYLVNMPKWQPSTKRVARSEELKEVARRLDKDGYVFIRGVGGLGKSELAKLFATEYSEKYHTVQFYKYSGSLKMLTASLKIQGLKNEHEKTMDELAQTKNRILHTCDNRTLIVVDNFNVTHDAFLREFLPTNGNQFKVIFTTRCLLEADYYKDKIYELPTLSKECCEELFIKHCQRTFNEEELHIVSQIVQIMACHTLAVVLAGKTVGQTGVSLKEMLEKLEHQELKKISTQIFYEYDISDQDIKAYNQLYGHLNVVFSVSNLEKKELEILKNMTLVSVRGIDTLEFVKYCKRSGRYPMEVIRSLVTRGWLEYVSDNTIAMHPIISDMIASNMKIRKSRGFYKFAQYLEDYCTADTEDHISVSESKLLTAIQLDKRYQRETISKQLVVQIKLGRLYTYMYQADLAHQYLDEAEHIAKKYIKLQYLPFIYFYRGFYEEEFGTKTRAIDYFFKAISRSNWVRNWDYRRRLENEAMEQVAFIHKENKEYELAFYEYRRCLWHAKISLLSYRVSDLANQLVEISRQLGWTGEEERYLKEKQQFLEYDLDDETEDEKLFAEHIRKGEFGYAMEAYDRILKQKRELLGEDSPIYQDMKHNGWVSYLLKGKKEETLRAVTASLEFCEQKHGKDSMGMAEELALIGLLICEQGELEFATECANRAIAICEKKKEVDSYTYFQAKIALAKICSLCGKINEGGEILSEVNFKTCVSNEQLGDVIKNLGFLFVELGQYDAISEMCNRFVARKNISNYDKFWTHLILGEIAREKGLLEEAKKHALSVKMCIEKLKDFPKQQDIFLSYYRMVAKIAYSEENFEEAVAYIDKLIAIYPKEERNSSAFAISVMERGLYQAFLGNLEESDRDYKWCEEILDSLDSPRESYCILYNNRSINHINKGAFDEARECLENIVEIMPAVLTPKTQFDVWVCANLGYAMLGLGENAKAEELFYKAIRAMEELGLTKSKDYTSLVEELRYQKLSQEEES